MLNESQKQRAINRILTFESSVSKAFVRRRCDGIFAKVGYMVSEKVLNEPLQAIWLGWETLTDSLYIGDNRKALYNENRDINQDKMAHYTG